MVYSQNQSPTTARRSTRPKPSPNQTRRTASTTSTSQILSCQTSWTTQLKAINSNRPRPFQKYLRFKIDSLRFLLRGQLHRDYLRGKSHPGRSSQIRRILRPRQFQAIQRLGSGPRLLNLLCRHLLYHLQPLHQGQKDLLFQRPRRHRSHCGPPFQEVFCSCRDGQLPEHLHLRIPVLKVVQNPQEGHRAVLLFC